MHALYASTHISPTCSMHGCGRHICKSPQCGVGTTAAGLERPWPHHFLEPTPGITRVVINACIIATMSIELSLELLLMLLVLVSHDVENGISYDSPL